MAKWALKILWCEHPKIFKCLAIFYHHTWKDQFSPTWILNIVCRELSSALMNIKITHAFYVQCWFHVIMIPKRNLASIPKENLCCFTSKRSWYNYLRTTKVLNLQQRWFLSFWVLPRFHAAYYKPHCHMANEKR